MTTEPVEENPAAEPQPAPANDAADPVAALEQQVAALKDQNLRHLAEMENVRRRAQKEREDASKYAVSGFAKDLLAVADNFERALASAPRDGLPDSVKNLVAGIEATGRQLAAALERAGIRKIESIGLSFDPHMHQVMTEIDDPSKPAGTVVQEMQPGYMIHDRLLREALVAVSKGGAAAEHKVDTSA